MKLTKESQKIFNIIQKDYSIHDEAGKLLLQIVCESLDTIGLAEIAIAKYGIVIEDKYRALKANPACTVVDKSRGAMMQALRQLSLDWDDISKLKK